MEDICIYNVTNKHTNVCCHTSDKTTQVKTIKSTEKLK